MSDTAINQIVQYGTNAAMMAYTPDPPAGIKTLYLWEDTDTPGDLYMWDGSAWVLTGSGTGAGITALTGDVTATGPGSAAATIANDAVTFAKMQNITSDRLLGRDTAGSGNAEEISVGGGVEFSGSTSIQRSALTGDITASAGSNTTTLAGGALVDDGNSGTSKTIDWLSLKIGRHKLTLTGSVTLTLDNPVSGGVYVLLLYTGAGSFTVTWPASVKWPSGTAPTITTTASRMDLVTLIYDGTDYFGSFNQNYTP